MAMKSRKGFVYTLEGVIASALMLGVMLTVIPEFDSSSDQEPRKQVVSGLQTLDSNGSIDSDTNASELRGLIEPYVPEGFSYSVGFVNLNSTERKISSPYSEYFDAKGNYSELQLWIDSASGLEVEFGGEKVLDGFTGSGYVQRGLDSNEGWLNFTSTGELSFSVNGYERFEGSRGSDSVNTVGYIISENTTREVRVNIWR